MKRDPKHFLNLEQTVRLMCADSKQALEGQAKQLQLVRRERGHYGGTWGTKELAIAYAKYLSPKFHLWALKVIRGAVDTRRETGVRVERKGYAAWRIIPRVQRSEQASRRVFVSN